MDVPRAKWVELLPLSGEGRGWQAQGVEGSHAPFLELLDPPARAAVECLGTSRHVRAGTMLLLEGERAGRLLVVVDGLVKLTASDSSGTEVVLAVRGAGELVGEVASLDGDVRSATATALVDSTVRSVGIDEFTGLLVSHPSAALAVIRTLTGRLRESDRARVEYAADAVPRRLARTLLQLATAHGTVCPDGAITLDLPFTQEELAGSVAASRDAVAKTLTAWRRQGLVDTARRRITLCDPAALSRQHRL